MNTPKNLKYARTHEWVEFLDANTAKIGLTDFAQKKLGKLVFVNLPLVGDTLAAGEALGDVESVKAVSEVLSPVSGTVTATNEALSSAPESINTDPYGTWLIEVGSVTGFAELMDASAYETFCANA